MIAEKSERKSVLSLIGGHIFKKEGEEYAGNHVGIGQG